MVCSNVWAPLWWVGSIQVYLVHRWICGLFWCVWFILMAVVHFSVRVSFKCLWWPKFGPWWCMWLIMGSVVNSGACGLVWCLSVLICVCLSWHMSVCPNMCLSCINSGKSAVLSGKFALGNSRGQIFQTTLRTFHCLSDFGIKTVKNMRPRVALGLCLNIFLWTSSEVCRV